MSHTSGEMDEILHAARGVRGGGGGSSRDDDYDSSHVWRSADEPNAITYQDLVLLAKRFRDEREKGRVLYRGKLMQLLDVPNLAKHETALVRDLTRLEQSGRTLEEIVALLDFYNDKSIRAGHLREGLEQLCPRSFGGQPLQT